MKLSFLPVKMRLPLKFGAEPIDSILIAHVEYPAYGVTGRGETPLSVAWAWSAMPRNFIREPPWNMKNDFRVCTSGATG